MKEKKTKEKKPKSGFALRLICAIIYLFSAVGLLLGSAYFYSQNHKNTFIEWFFNDYWSSNLKFSNKDIVYQESDKQYVESDWWDFNFDQDSKSLNARYEVPEKHNEEKYALAQDGIDDGRATLLNGAGGQIIIRYGGQNQSFAAFLYENQDWSEFYRSDIDGDVNGGNNFVEVKIKSTGDFILSVRYPQNTEDRYDYEKYVTESYKLTADSETNRTATFTGENGNAVKVKYSSYGLSDWFDDFEYWNSYFNNVSYEDGQDLPNYAQIMCYPENVEILFDFTLTDVSYETETYKYLSEDAAAKTITLENAASEKMTVCYGDCYQYNDYIYYDGWSGYGGGKESFIVLLVFGIFSAVLTVLQTIGAFAGRKRKGGNNLCIFTGIFMAPALLGLLSFFGGWYGNRALDYKYPEKAKKLGSGFGYRLTFAIMILLFAIGFSLGFGLPFMLYSGMSFIEIFLIAFLPGILIGALGIALIIGAAAGKKHKWGNVLHIVFGALTCPGYIGLFALVGGIKGNRYIDERPAEAIIENESVDTVLSEAGAVAAQSVSSELVKGDSVEEARNRVLTDYPIDYENKPAVSRLLDFDNRENLVLTNEEGLTVEFAQRYITVQNGNLYLLTETVGLSEEEGGGAVVFRVDYAADTFYLENDDNISQAVFDEYKTALKNSQTYEKQSIKRSDFKLDLYDTNVDEKTWKQFKKTATQDELTVIAIGAKYRIAHSRIKNLIYALGIVLSIALFWPTGGWSLIGYPVFAFLATKSIRYEDTYSQSYRKLSKENRAFVDGYFNSNVGLTIVDTIIKIVLFWITIPYQAILLLIGMFAPNFVISKNGILVSIPKGYDVGGLGAVGAYYESFNFIDEALANSKTAKRVIKIDGNEVTEQPYVIDDRGQKVYKDANGNEYVSDDGGKTAREYHRYD